MRTLTIATCAAMLVAGIAYPIYSSVSAATRRDSSPRKAAFTPPPVPREFRAAWVATVDNIDWPTKRGLPVEQQKAQIIRILDKAAALNLNAIVLQIRPCCDAMYPSKLEPWSEYLTGRQGLAPEPFYDPLAMWIQEAHKRGIELHAWLNPYRARHPSAKQSVCAEHVSIKKPKIVRTYGRHLWLDPGEPETQKHSLDVILDVVNRYDVDGIHMDDYFYPYKEKDAAGNTIDFPDDASYRKYVASVEKGEALSREDWRRHNVDSFIEKLYRSLKRAKPYVKFGISPFGIWRPGHPAQIQGMDQYSMLYADARKWIREGWCDYWTPQLYWPIAQTPQSYPVLLKWWIDQNLRGRHVWPGNFTSRIADGSRTAWKASELLDQIKLTRKEDGAEGNVHFSMITLLENRGGVADALRKQVYSQPALVPASPWLDDGAPATPIVKLESFPGDLRLTMRRGNRKPVWLWVIQSKSGSGWKTDILSGDRSSFVPNTAGPAPEAIAVSAIDRCGAQSEPAVVEVGG